MKSMKIFNILYLVNIIPSIVLCYESSNKSANEESIKIIANS